MQKLSIVREVCLKYKYHEKTVHSFLKKLNKLVDGNVRSIALKCSTRYTRNLLFRCEEFEVILMRWPVGISSPPHDHNNSNCFVIKNRGSLQEVGYELCGDSIRSIRDCVLYRNIVYSNLNVRSDIHSLKNIGRKTAYTLHLYASPISECIRYGYDGIVEKIAFEENYL
ncbi:cysteine dioxygenase [Francisella philomiragia]|uniref:cysteine dioxygenase n=1 Tax=Francisella philomiragia TaxID=28110 RepID=UPI0019058686|nr:cysteine dioxygenase family protein [Francisella philomiragia]MBK2105439.1 cysteine dioxygenase family protein [Francisella philomiragia]